jgi:MYND finger
MAACPVRFEFYCGEEELKYVHNVPRNLVTAGVQAAQKDAGYGNLFLNTLQPIIKEHEAACLANSNAFCENCGSPRVTALQTPMSWLQNVGDPFVAIWVNPVCGKDKCQTQVRQQVQEIMAEVVAEGQGRRAPGPSTSVEILACRICWKTEGTMRCGRCKVAAYCGREHQRADWKAHKKSCMPKDGGISGERHVS